MNSFSAIGRLGRDATMRYTQGGKGVLSFPLAVDDGWGDNKTTTWMDCSLWGDRGEKLAEHLRKGDQVGVTGSIGTREHEGKTYVTVRVSDVSLIGGKKSEEKPKREDAPKREAPAKSSAFADDFQDDDIGF